MTPSIVLQQVSNKIARENAARTLHKPVALKHVTKHLNADAAKHVEDSCPSGAVYVWGAKPEQSHQTVKMVDRQSVVFFRRGDTVYKRGVVIETTTNESLAESLWARDTDGEVWSTVFLFSKITDMNRSAPELNLSLGRKPDDHWQGLIVLRIKDSEVVRSFLERELS